jgi:hypothetical protein
VDAGYEVDYDFRGERPNVTVSAIHDRDVEAAFD